MQHVQSYWTSVKPSSPCQLPEALQISLGRKLLPANGSFSLAAINILLFPFIAFTYITTYTLISAKSHIYAIVYAKIQVLSTLRAQKNSKNNALHPFSNKQIHFPKQYFRKLCNIHNTLHLFLWNCTDTAAISVCPKFKATAIFRKNIILHLHL